MISLISYLPQFLAGGLLLGLPLQNKVGLLCSTYLVRMWRSFISGCQNLTLASPELGDGPAVIMSLSWVTSTVSGHTKKVTMNAIWFIGYSMGHMLAPQPWKEQYKPRNLVPWSILMASWSCQVLVSIAFYLYLKQENQRREERVTQLRSERPPADEKTENHVHPDLEPYEEYSWVNIPANSGGTKRTRIEKRFLDLTDKENLSFRYVL